MYGYVNGNGGTGGMQAITITTTTTRDASDCGLARGEDEARRRAKLGLLCPTRNRNRYRNRFPGIDPDFDLCLNGEEDNGD